VSGAGTLLLLPALLRLLERFLFKAREGRMPSSCRCGLCIFISITAVVLLALNFYSRFGWAYLTWISVFVIPALAFVCLLLSRRASCREAPGMQGDQKENVDET
jgi:hypothetical protein